MRRMRAKYSLLICRRMRRSRGYGGRYFVRVKSFLVYACQHVIDTRSRPDIPRRFPSVIYVGILFVISIEDCSEAVSEDERATPGSALRYGVQRGA